MAVLKRGLVQVYTGAGKGKTTAAFGLAWRMLGWGGKVYICQFLKPAAQVTGEALLAERWAGRLILERLEPDWDLRASEQDPAQREQMRRAISRKLEQVLAIIDRRAGHVEVVLTGREAGEELRARADLVTEMRLVKHPYERGIAARKGIEY